MVIEISQNFIFSFMNYNKIMLKYNHSMNCVIQKH